jgi:hypothetical protein
MFLEDIIQHAIHVQGLHSRDNVMLNSFSNQIWMGNSLTQKQVDAAVKLLKRYETKVTSYVGQDIAADLKTPTLKMGVRQIVPQIKKITYEEEGGKRFNVSFPYDENLVGKLRSFNDKTHADSTSWNSESKVWVFPLTERAVMFLKGEMLAQGFEVCERTQDIFNQVDDILEHFEYFVPQLKYDNDMFYFKNTHHSVPQPQDMNFLETLYHAKRYGINTWDPGIHEALKNGNFSHFTKNFLNPAGVEDFTIIGDDHGIEIFDELINLLTPTLVIIPPGSEIIHLRKWWTYLSTKNFTKNQISVMFRTDNNTDRIFNELVKDQELNSPISEDTKFVFVSHKLPKPIVKSKIEFKLVINLGALPGVHYSLQSYLADFPDQVKYTNRKK